MYSEIVSTTFFLTVSFHLKTVPSIPLGIYIYIYTTNEKKALVNSKTTCIFFLEHLSWDIRLKKEYKRNLKQIAFYTEECN